MEGIVGTESENNKKVDEYKEHLYKAEADIEAALRSVCSMSGENIPRCELNQALEKVQDAIRSAWRLYK